MDNLKSDKISSTKCVVTEQFQNFDLASHVRICRQNQGIVFANKRNNSNIKDVPIILPSECNFNLREHVQKARQQDTTRTFTKNLGICTKYINQASELQENQSTIASKQISDEDKRVTILHKMEDDRSTELLAKSTICVDKSSITSVSPKVCLKRTHQNPTSLSECQDQKSEHLQKIPRRRVSSVDCALSLKTRVLSHEQSPQFRCLPLST